LSSIEPRYVTEELIDFMAGNKRMCRHLHIPLQSGDDEILKKMNRPYTQDGYRRLVSMARAKIEGVAITTDVLIGFPGESDNNFNNTLAFVKEMAPSRTHIFTYSRRELTPAAALTGDVPADVLKNRYERLKAAASEASFGYRKGFLGSDLDVLVETKRDRASGLLKGYSDNYIKVLFKGPDSIMKNVVRVRIKEADAARTLGTYE
jgi:threonylcarbamoyladenosine tRNA methylthiotransferase MtaB